MTANQDGRDLFDFSLNDLVPKTSNEPAKETSNSEQRSGTTESALLNSENEAITSYLLVNALLNLLIAKGVIYPHEVNALLSELHVEYRKHKKE